MKITQNQVRVACDWWASALGGPVRIASPESGPEDRNTELSYSVTVEMHRQRSPITPEQLGRFKDALLRELTSQNPWVFGVDYGPDRVLAAAAEASGIHKSHFPPKTNMWLNDDGSVEVALGYGAAPVRIWPEVCGEPREVGR